MTALVLVMVQCLNFTLCL